MTYCWRSQFRGNQYADNPGVQAHAERESCAFQTSPAVSKLTMSQKALAMFGTYGTCKAAQNMQVCIECAPMPRRSTSD